MVGNITENTGIAVIIIVLMLNWIILLVEQYNITGRAVNLTRPPLKNFWVKFNRKNTGGRYNLTGGGQKIVGYRRGVERVIPRPKHGFTYFRLYICV